MMKALVLVLVLALTAPAGAWFDPNETMDQFYIRQQMEQARVDAEGERHRDAHNLRMQIEDAQEEQDVEIRKLKLKMKRILKKLEEMD